MSGKVGLLRGIYGGIGNRNAIGTQFGPGAQTRAGSGNFDDQLAGVEFAYQLLGMGQDAVGIRGVHLGLNLLGSQLDGGM